jgi:hypothetical protein
MLTDSPPSQKVTIGPWDIAEEGVPGLIQPLFAAGEAQGLNTKGIQALS